MAGCMKAVHEDADVLPEDICKNLYCQTDKTKGEFWCWISPDYLYLQQKMLIYPPEFEAFHLMVVPLINDLLRSET